MKCPKCEENHRRGRDGMFCDCGYRFVFDPKEERMTDWRFEAIVRQASSNGTYYFTLNQLYGAACRRLKIQWGGGCLLLFLFLFGVGVTIGTSDSPLSGTIPTMWGIFVVIAFLVVRSSFRPRLSRAKWDRFVQRWERRNGPIEKLVRSPMLEEAPPEWSEPDIFGYGVERVLICERDELVDWLVLNRIHVNEQTAVMSASGYPQYLLPKVNDLLRGPNPPNVFLLHDATRKGEAMERHLRQSGPFSLEGAEVIDLGLDPEVVPRVRSLRKVRRGVGDGEMPVDAIPFGVLSTMVTCGFLEMHPFSQFEQGGSGEASLVYETSISDDGDGE